MAEQLPPNQKRSSYPSRQRRQGPAPLASFEDLSDEIESPSEKNSHSMPEIEEELKLYADEATPSTPRVLETSPVTPGADLSSLSTPHVDSFPVSWEDGATTGGSAELSQEGSTESVIEAAPSQVVSFQVVPTCNGKSKSMNGANIKNSKSSSFMEDVRGAEAASALASQLPERSATPECLPQAAPIKKTSLTSSHLSGQSSRTPSRTPSPNSPRRFFSFFKHRDESSEPGSPASPKSPRKTSFTNLFKIGGRGEDRSTSPTGRKSSLSIFFKSGKDGSKLKKTPEEGPDNQLSSKGKKDASNRSMFSTLFRKGDRKSDKKAPVKLTLQASSMDVPIELDTGTGGGWTSREISLHSHLCDLLDDDGEPLEGTEEVELTNGKSRAQQENVEVHVDAAKAMSDSATDEERATAIEDQIKDNQLVDQEANYTEFYAVAAAVVAKERRSRRPLDRGDAVTSEDAEGVSNREVVVLPPVVEPQIPPPTDDRISSGSEQESDFDPVSLKKRPTSEDYEAETLIDEDVEYDDFVPTQSLPAGAMMDNSVMSKKQFVTPIRRQRLVDMTTIPIDRPRSSTPLSITSLEAYIQTASPPLERAANDAEKLKVSLPRDEFSARGRSPRKVPVKNWQDFCQEVLQSPRTKRKDDEDEVVAVEVSEVGAVASSSVASPPSTRSWVTFENVVDMVTRVAGTSEAEGDGKKCDEYTANLNFEQNDLTFHDNGGFATSPLGISDHSSAMPTISAEDCKCECHKLHPNGVRTASSPRGDVSSQTSVSVWARDRSTQMPSQDSTTSEPFRGELSGDGYTASMESAASSSEDAAVVCSVDSVDGTDPLLVNHGTAESEAEELNRGAEFTDAHTCTQHAISPSFDHCHVLFPHNGEKGSEM